MNTFRGIFMVVGMYTVVLAEDPNIGNAVMTASFTLFVTNITSAISTTPESATSTSFRTVTMPSSTILTSTNTASSSSEILTTERSSSLTGSLETSQMELSPKSTATAPFASSSTPSSAASTSPSMTFSMTTKSSAALSGTSTAVPVMTSTLIYASNAPGTSAADITSERSASSTTQISSSSLISAIPSQPSSTTTETSITERSISPASSLETSQSELSPKFTIPLVSSIPSSNAPMSSSTIFTMATETTPSSAELSGTSTKGQTMTSTSPITTTSIQISSVTSEVTSPTLSTSMETPQVTLSTSTSISPSPTSIATTAAGVSSSTPVATSTSSAISSPTQLSTEAGVMTSSSSASSSAPTDITSQVLLSSSEVNDQSTISLSTANTAGVSPSTTVTPSTSSAVSSQSTSSLPSLAYSSTESITLVTETTSANDNSSMTDTISSLAASGLDANQSSSVYIRKQSIISSSQAVPVPNNTVADIVEWLQEVFKNNTVGYMNLVLQNSPKTRADTEVDFEPIRYEVYYNVSELSENAAVCDEREGDKCLTAHLYNTLDLILARSEPFSGGFYVETEQTNTTMSSDIQRFTDADMSDPCNSLDVKVCFNINNTCYVNEGAIVCEDKCVIYQNDTNPECTNPSSGLKNIYIKGECRLSETANPECDCGYSPGNVMPNFYDGVNCISSAFVVGIAAGVGGFIIVVLLGLAIGFGCRSSEAEGSKDDDESYAEMSFGASKSKLPVIDQHDETLNSKEDDEGFESRMMLNEAIDVFVPNLSTVDLHADYEIPRPVLLTTKDDAEHHYKIPRPIFDDSGV